jgi:hypothetical protein
VYKPVYTNLTPEEVRQALLLFVQQKRGMRFASQVTMCWYPVGANGMTRVEIQNIQHQEQNKEE